MMTRRQLGKKEKEEKNWRKQKQNQLRKMNELAFKKASDQHLLHRK